MERLNLLSDFFRAIANDPRIGVSHISVYCALLQSCHDVQNRLVAEIKSAELMKVAKISGLGTYHKCIRDLNSFGYICYRPSYNHRRKSNISLLHIGKI